MSDDAIHRILLERTEIQLQLTAVIMADLEVISDQLSALHPRQNSAVLFEPPVSFEAIVKIAVPSASQIFFSVLWR